MTGFIPRSRVRALVAFAAVIACLGLAGIALAIRPRAGHYTGRTSAGKKFEFTFKTNDSGTRVSRLVVDVKRKCNVRSEAGLAEYHLGAPGFFVARIRHGRFVYMEDGLVIKAHFTNRRRAEGTVRLYQRYSTPDGKRVVCDSGRRSWSAVHR